MTEEQKNKRRKLSRYRSRIWRLANPARNAASHKNWRKKQTSGQLAARLRKWRIENPDKHRKLRRRAENNQYKNNPQRKFAQRFRGRVRAEIRKSGGQKINKASQLLGCSFTELKNYLESLFQPGMSWENYGLYGWHIDHKIPCSAFDLTDLEQQKACFHFSNLQPLWAKDNLVKGNKIL